MRIAALFSASGGFTEDDITQPRFVIGGHLDVAIDQPRPREGFQCWLNDGRLDGAIPGGALWRDETQLSRPSTARLRNDAHFAQSCIGDIELGDDGGIRIVSSELFREVRASFRYFPRSQRGGRGGGGGTAPRGARAPARGAGPQGPDRSPGPAAVTQPAARLLRRGAWGRK